MKRISQALVVVSILTAVCAESAEAYRVRHHAWYDADAVAKQQRANMAERTHQLKERQESARLSRQGGTASASTIKEYPSQGQSGRKRLWKMKMAARNSAK